jgi:hypothetical protein
MGTFPVRTEARRGSDDHCVGQHGRRPPVRPPEARRDPRTVR